MLARVSKIWVSSICWRRDIIAWTLSVLRHAALPRPLLRPPRSLERSRQCAHIPGRCLGPQNTVATAEYRLHGLSGGVIALLSLSPAGEHLLSLSPAGEHLLSLSPAGEYLLSLSPAGEYLLSLSLAGEHLQSPDGGYLQTTAIVVPAGSQEDVLRRSKHLTCVRHLRPSLSRPRQLSTAMTPNRTTLRPHCTFRSSRLPAMRSQHAVRTLAMRSQHAVRTPAMRIPVDAATIGIPPPLTDGHPPTNSPPAPAVGAVRTMTTWMSGSILLPARIQETRPVAVGDHASRKSKSRTCALPRARFQCRPRHSSTRKCQPRWTANTKRRKSVPAAFAPHKAILGCARGWIPEPADRNSNASGATRWRSGASTAVSPRPQATYTGTHRRPRAV